jgi:hypothetical protein
MKRGAMLAAVAVLSLAGLPATASADFYITQKRAQLFAEHEAADRYGTVADDGTTVSYAAACRPQGISWRYERIWRVNRFHRWTCAWVDYGYGPNDTGYCKGQLLILGNSRGPRYYFVRVLRGQRCES